MRFQTFLSLSLLLVFSGPSRAATCPDLSSAETTLDCPWAGAGRALLESAGNQKSLEKKLGKLLPSLLKQIKIDSKRKAFKEVWGQSTNFDDLEKATIIDPLLLSSLMDLMKVPTGHAGVTHTYGYLLSTLKTGYGFKRERWVRNEIENGLKLPAGSLSPKTREGTFFGNVTYFLSQIAFRHESPILQSLAHQHGKLAQGLLQFPYKNLKTIRVEEKVETPQAITLRTDFVPFQTTNSFGNSYLLVYSVADASTESAKLITAFPVQKSFVDQVLSPDTLGDGKEIKIRYNADLETVSGRHWKGSRKITENTYDNAQ